MREYGFDYLRAVEVQDRGALHLHLICHADEPMDPLTVQRLALAAGFGCVMDLAPITPGSRKHAYYVSKYVTKACDQRGQVPWARDRVDTYTGEIYNDPRPTFRTWSSSRGWGLTMAALKADAARLAEAARARARTVTPDPLTTDLEPPPSSATGPPV
jgi:hypothetical protein